MEYEQRETDVSAVHRPTIMIVDDECELRNVLGLGLRERGYKVVEADSVYAAKQLIRENARVEVVICDVRMPGGPDGTALAVWLYQFLPETILILTSGYFPRAEAEPGPLVYGYRLPKPFRPSQAASLIERCLEKKAQDLARTVRPPPDGWS